MHTARSTSRTLTGSFMESTVAPQTTVEKSTVSGWLGSLSRRWGLSPSYTKQQCFAGFGVFDRAAEAVEEMLKDGRPELVALRCARLDAIRAAYHVPATAAEHRIALHENFTRDAAENPATSAHAMEMSPASWDTARRLLVKEIAAKWALIRSGDSLFREGM